MSNPIQKLENPVRLAEINPSKTLREMGLTEDDVFCDIGAGTGIFAFAATAITQKSIFALEKSSELINYLDSKAKRDGYANLKVIQVGDDGFGLPNESCDKVMLCTVLHEIEGKKGFLLEVLNILRKNGRLAVIEFHKRETPMGPPVTHRIGNDEVISLVDEAGFSLVENITLSDNFYLLVFEK